MSEQELKRELSAPGVHELLESAPSAHLAYVAMDGTPRVVPVGYWWTGREFVISTATTAPKVKALGERAEVALSIETGDSPEGARALSVRGRADVQIVAGVVDEYLQAARKNMDAESAEQFEQQCRQMYEQMARIAITSVWVRFYDFGAGRMPKFLGWLSQPPPPPKAPIIYIMLSKAEVTYGGWLTVCFRETWPLYHESWTTIVVTTNPVGPGH